MQKACLAASIAAMTGAMSLDDPKLDLAQLKIIYPEGRINDVQVSRELYPSVFKFPKDDPYCGGTMISPQMALTSANCVSTDEDSTAQDLSF